MIKKVCVIGSGVMGRGIAAQIANSKTEVMLFDLATKDNADRSVISRSAKESLLNAKPSPLSHIDNMKYIHPYNLEDDLDMMKNADLIIEAILEDINVKHSLFNQIIPYIKDDAIIASNTSTLPLSAISQPFLDSIRRRLFITHFFNPPRYMELLEFVLPKEHDTNLADILENFMHDTLGRTVIKCNDTPGFIANRIGCFLLENSVRLAIEKKLNPVMVDGICNKYFGFPSTGIFGLYDLIGHDVMRLISASLSKALPEQDKYHQILTDNDILKLLQENGSLGRKSGKGFYKQDVVDGKKTKSYFDFQKRKYLSISDDMNLPESFEAIFNKNDDYSIFFKEMMQAYLLYANMLVPKVTEKYEDVDHAMKLGYAFLYGPFEFANKFGKFFELDFDHKIVKNNLSSKLSSGEKNKIILKNDSAFLANSEDDNLIFYITSKMGVLNEDIFNLLLSSIDLAESSNKALIVTSEAKYFSVGADLKYFLHLIENKNFKAITDFISMGQKAIGSLKNRNIKTVAAAEGMALGGGMEILLHVDKVYIHQNIIAGLVEMQVGLIPGWGGMKQMFMLGKHDAEILEKLLSNVILARKSSSAEYLHEQFMLNCKMVMHKDNILKEALSDIKNVSKPIHDVVFKIPQVNIAKSIQEPIGGFSKLQLEIMSLLQLLIDKISITEKELLEFEMETFVMLCKKQETYDLIKTTIHS